MGHTQETICWIASAFERSTTLLSTWHQRLMFYVSLCLFRIEINGRQKQNQQHVSLRSQNSFPLHLARHAVASTDRVFFEPHARAKGSPPQLCRGVAVWLWEREACLVWVGHLFARASRYRLHALREPGAGMDGCLGNETWLCWFMLCSATRELNQQDREMPVCVS